MWQKSRIEIMNKKICWDIFGTSYQSVLTNEEEMVIYLLQDLKCPQSLTIMLNNTNHKDLR